MLPPLRRFTFFSAAAAALAMALPWASAAQAAAQFEQQPIDPSRVIAIATPVRGGALHTLMVLEQVGNQRPCWQESGGSPVRVEPLLLTFDFTGICNRLSDSNTYSLRISGQDLGLAYRLEVRRQGSDLVLVASPLRDRANFAPIEIGRAAGGAVNDFVKLELNSGWQLTRRVYNGQALNHVYLTHDQPLGVPVASATGPAPTPPSQPAPVNPPAQPPSANPPLPTIPPQATNPLPPPPNTGSSTYYRVIVPITGPNTLPQVRAVEPESFRTTVDGQSVVQVGLFREQQRAEEVRQSLVQANLPAQIVAAAAPAVAGTPQAPVIPQGQTVVVIDPGHGGRDPGAIGIGGIQEKTINLAIAQRVQQRLQQAGITAVMTRSDDRSLDLDPRVVYASQVDADLFVSIHANAISMSRPEVNGLETYYYASGQRLAQAIHSSVLQQTNLRDRGVRQARFYVLRYSAMPAVLVETGFVTGAEDAARFRNGAERDRIGDAIAQGILNYLRP